jgi:hypothetical protein
VQEDADFLTAMYSMAVDFTKYVTQDYASKTEDECQDKEHGVADPLRYKAACSTNDPNGDC